MTAIDARPAGAPAPGPDPARPLSVSLAGLWWIPRAMALGLLAFVIFGPLANLVLWTVAERWYFPHALPLEYGFSYWAKVFSPRGNAMESLTNSVLVASLTVGLALALAVPAGYALARLKLPFRALILLAFLIPQAFPNLPVYVNIARLFYQIGLNGTVAGVVLVHVTHGLVYAVWIATAAFSAVDRELEEAARSLGARRPARLSRRDTAACRARAACQRRLRLPGIARRVHRQLFRRRAGTSTCCRCCSTPPGPAAIIRLHRSPRCCSLYRPLLSCSSSNDSSNPTCCRRSAIETREKREQHRGAPLRQRAAGGQKSRRVTLGRVARLHARRQHRAGDAREGDAGGP